MLRPIKLRWAIYLPSGTSWARALEQSLPSTLPWGGLLLAAGEKF